MNLVGFMASLWLVEIKLSESRKLRNLEVIELFPIATDFSGDKVESDQVLNSLRKEDDCLAYSAQ